MPENDLLKKFFEANRMPYEIKPKALSIGHTNHAYLTRNYTNKFHSLWTFLWHDIN